MGQYYYWSMRHAMRERRKRGYWYDGAVIPGVRLAAGGVIVEWVDARESGQKTIDRFRRARYAVNPSYARYGAREPR